MNGVLIRGEQINSISYSKTSYGYSAYVKLNLLNEFVIDLTDDCFEENNSVIYANTILKHINKKFTRLNFELFVIRDYDKIIGQRLYEKFDKNNPKHQNASFIFIASDDFGFLHFKDFNFIHIEKRKQ